MDAYLNKKMNQDSFEDNKRRMEDVVDCLVVSKGDKDSKKVLDLILSLLFTLKLTTVKDKIEDAEEAANFETTVGDEREKNDIIIHKSLINSLKLSFTKRNIIPFLVRLNLIFVKNEKIFNTILELFRMVDNDKDKAFESYKTMMMRQKQLFGLSGCSF